MVVLVRPMPEAAAGGVMFGADPVEGRYDHVLVNAVTGDGSGGARTAAGCRILHAPRRIASYL